jgi:hypothetical protein
VRIVPLPADVRGAHPRGELDVALVIEPDFAAQVAEGSPRPCA